MAKKQASHADYEVIVEDSGKIVVKQSGQIVPNAKGALREIATAVGFALDSKWNTQQAGSKLVDYLKTVSVHSAQVVPEPAAKSIAPKAATAPNNNNTSKEKDELTTEEMKKLDEILQRLEALEARIAELESAPVTASVPTASTKLTGKVVRANYPSLFHGRWLGYVWLINRSTVTLSDGRRGYLLPISTDEGNYTVGQTRKVADMFGYKYDSKTKREALGWELVSKYGDSKWAFIGTKAVDDGGVTYDFIETDNLYNPDALAFASNKYSNAKSFFDLYQGTPFSVNPNWTKEQIHENLVQFIKNLVRK